MEIVTLVSSMPGLTSSYSKLTVQPLPAIDGQQLTCRGNSDSSLVARHLSTLIALPMGKGRGGSLCDSTFSAAQSDLLMLGCVLNWKPLFSPIWSSTRVMAASGSDTVSLRSPTTKMSSKPPSRASTQVSFSSTSIATASDDACAGAAALPPGARAAGPGPVEISPSSARTFIRSLVLLALSFMPRICLGGAVRCGGADGRATGSST
mmetsp:Transcript_25671/g.59171  ORF Transcript_25671/g.59171 Transcript_25671/m.59171 type:complete len:207 (-) Transcript_25671:703-1323(-)